MAAPWLSEQTGETRARCCCFCPGPTRGHLRQEGEVLPLTPAFHELASVFLSLAQALREPQVSRDEGREGYPLPTFRALDDPAGAAVASAAQRGPTREGSPPWPAETEGRGLLCPSWVFASTHSPFSGHHLSIQAWNSDTSSLKLVSDSTDTGFRSPFQRPVTSPGHLYF